MGHETLTHPFHQDTHTPFPSGHTYTLSIRTHTRPFHQDTHTPFPPGHTYTLSHQDTHTPFPSGHTYIHRFHQDTHTPFSIRTHTPFPSGHTHALSIRTHIHPFHQDIGPHTNLFEEVLGIRGEVGRDVELSTQYSLNRSLSVLGTKWRLQRERHNVHASLAAHQLVNSSSPTHSLLMALPMTH